MHKQGELAQKLIKLTKVFHDEVGIPNGQLELCNPACDRMTG